MVTRQYVVWGSLVLTLAACIWVSQQEETQEIVVVSQHRTMPRKSIDVGLSNHRDNEKIVFRQADTSTPVDLFAPLIVEVDSASAATNPTSTTPSNPYSYAGKIQEEGVWTVFLTDGSQNFAVKAGEKLNDGWRLKSIDAQTLTLFYAPMRVEVSINIGA